MDKNIYKYIVIGFFIGLSFGLWQVCKSKDKTLELQKSINIRDIQYSIEASKNIDNNGIPKNLPKIEDLK